MVFNHRTAQSRPTLRSSGCRWRPGPATSSERLHVVRRLAGIRAVAAALLAVAGCTADPPLDPAEQAAVEKIRALGGSVTIGAVDEKPTVQKVDLRRTATTDDDLAVLRDLPNVVQLRLARTNIGDAGLVHVAALTKLQELYLGRTQVTDKGLEALEGLQDLRWIAISHTEVTGDGLKRLQRSLPELKPTR